MTEKRFSFAKLVAVMALGLLAGIGLCGLDFGLAAAGVGKSKVEFGVGPLDGVSILVMALFALGLVVSLAAWLLAAIFRSSQSRDENDRQQ
ncbi:MAG: hypothetical protein P4K93_03395 [Terracidiphilus sp.]|nr:hypothetical protein [Terracidiphilus sp.]MDR3797169.1 hypothetical protein [Terracidiphilus sp.]